MEQASLIENNGYYFFFIHFRSLAVSKFVDYISQ